MSNFTAMNDKSYNVIGVMSGTSLDGIDLAHVNLSFGVSGIRSKILAAETIPYAPEWVQRLKVGVNLDTESLETLNTDYTILLGNVIATFIKKNSISNLDAVCSHGHTILHQPGDGVTLQIGNLPQLASIAGQTIVCDFRVQDVALGGQGAPLVPIGDRMLFPDYEYCLNLGGFSNISFEDLDKRIAFDISPVNTVLNHYAEEIGHPYDDRGAIAKSAACDAALLDELNRLPYYTQPYPKSLGIEFVNGVVLPLIEKYGLAPEVVLRTFTEHVAYQAAMVLKGKTGGMLVTGGGAYNDFLVNRMRELLPHIQITVPDDNTIQYKEALVFALLGVLRLRKAVNVLSSVTGAPYDHCAGYIYTTK